MSTNNWTRLAGALGGSAVLLGAMGAHAMIKKPETYRTIWNTATNYHLIHSVALLSSSLAFVGRKRNITCALFASGIILFSGTLYVIAIRENKEVLNKFTPVGGILLTLGWFAIFAF